MAPHVVCYRFGESRRLRVELGHLHVRLVGLRSHGRREEEDSCRKSGRDEDQAQIDKCRAVEGRNIPNALEMCYKIRRKPSCETTEDNNSIDARCEKTGRGLDAKVVNNGSIGRLALWCVKLMEGRYVTEK